MLEAGLWMPSFLDLCSAEHESRAMQADRMREELKDMGVSRSPVHGEQLGAAFLQVVGMGT